MKTIYPITSRLKAPIGGLGAAFLILTTFSLWAQSGSTIRVTNGQNLQTLIDENPAGTTFIVEAGVVQNDLSITKKVIIIGTGYFLNSGNTASPGVVVFNNIYLKDGSSGSYITGIQCNEFDIISNNNVIKSCYLLNNFNIGYNRQNNTWSGTANNCMILQNYAGRLHIINQNALSASANNIIVKGNIFRQGLHLEGNVSGVISNNSFMKLDYQYLNSYNSSYNGGISCKIMPIIFRNNIIPGIIAQNCNIYDYPTTDFLGNVFTQDFQNLLPGNTINANVDALFLGYPTNASNLAPDARSQLAAGSIAKTAGVGGTEAGAFGGDTPYVLSGIPTIPNIYQLTVPTQVPQNGTLNVTIKAKTNN